MIQTISGTKMKGIKIIIIVLLHSLLIANVEGQVKKNKNAKQEAPQEIKSFNKEEKLNIKKEIKAGDGFFRNSRIQTGLVPLPESRRH